VHAALFRLGEHDKLQLEAQHAPRGVTLAGLVNHSDHLTASPLRHAFPGLLAACSGELAYLDAPHKAGEPEMALALHDKGVEMVIGVPIPSPGPGGPLGALCLMFERHALLTHEELATLNDLAHLAGFGLRTADMGREGEQMLARLTYLAITDALTGVANRRRGEEVLELEIRRARRYKLPLAVIAFDVDHFKAINDRYGHAVGDVALRTVAAAARDALRSSDALARSGGEEFFIVASHTSAIDGLKLAEKLRLAIAGTEVPGCDRLTISLGVAQLAEHETGDALTVRLMAALARAKRAGRNCVELAMS
jgi:diguanylate cyclase (GGDEF)-like protein